MPADPASLLSFHFFYNGLSIPATLSPDTDIDDARQIGASLFGLQYDPSISFKYWTNGNQPITVNTPSVWRMYIYDRLHHNNSDPRIAIDFSDAHLTTLATTAVSLPSSSSPPFAPSNRENYTRSPTSKNSRGAMSPSHAIVATSSNSKEKMVKSKTDPTNQVRATDLPLKEPQAVGASAGNKNKIPKNAINTPGLEKEWLRSLSSGLAELTLTSKDPLVHGSMAAVPEAADAVPDVVQTNGEQVSAGQLAFLAQGTMQSYLRRTDAYLGSNGRHNRVYEVVSYSELLRE